MIVEQRGRRKGDEGEDGVLGLRVQDVLWRFRWLGSRLGLGLWDGRGCDDDDDDDGVMATALALQDTCADVYADADASKEKDEEQEEKEKPDGAGAATGTPYPIPRHMHFSSYSQLPEIHMDGRAQAAERSQVVMAMPTMDQGCGTRCVSGPSCGIHVIVLCCWAFGCWGSWCGGGEGEWGVENVRGRIKDRAILLLLLHHHHILPRLTTKTKTKTKTKTNPIKTKNRQANNKTLIPSHNHHHTLSTLSKKTSR